MKNRGILYWLVLAIALATLISGIVQLLNPGFVLRIVSAEETPATRHFFGIVGMFMALFGGMLAHALLRAERQTIILIWTGLQKIGASAAVGLGVNHQIFSSRALLISAFDLLSGILIFVYLGVLIAAGNTSWKPSSDR